MKNQTKPILPVLLLSFLLLAMNANGQQTAAFPEYNYNPFLINSAYAGMLPDAEISIGNSGFFNQIEGSPKNFSLSLHTPLSDGKIGVGAGIIRDQIGVTTNTNVFAAYSYKIFFDFKDDRPYWQIYQPGVLSFGITAGIQQFQDNLLELGIVDDPNFSENITATVPSIGVGFLFNHSRFYTGVSVPNILGDQLANRDDLRLSNPIYGYFGYRFFTNRYQEIMVKPNVLLKYEKGAPFQADINVAFSYKNKFELGAGFRTSSSANLLAGIYLFDSIRLIYHYNIALKQNPLGNTHGFLLSYRFGEGFTSR